MYTNENVNIKSNIINNIMLQMSIYLDAVTLDILQKVVEEQFVFLNVERITTLPAKVDTSTEEKNNISSTCTGLRRADWQKRRWISILER